METTKNDIFYNQLKQAIATEQLQLPSLPEVALRIKEECEKEETSIDDILEVLTQDSALSAKLMQVANSSLFLTRTPTTSLKQAVTLLGLRMVKDLVMSLAMKQLYHATTDILQERFKEIWLASTKTAAISRMLAMDIKSINSEQAMLAGLIHNIGALPILLMAEDDDELYKDVDGLCQIIKSLQGKTGALIFQAWHFPEYLSDIALHCYDFNREHDGPADYLDIIQAALIEGSIYTGLECPDDWYQTPCFNKLGINQNTNMMEIEENRIIFEETELLFQ